MPRLAAEWDLTAAGRRWQVLDATCCFVDISGFTALSERLARRGRVGAEELTEVLNHVFSRMLGVAYAKGGSLLKFGGDALLLCFTGPDHALATAEAAVAMRAALREARTLPTSVGRVNLRMSVGVHSGDFHLFRVGRSHQELLVTGPAATTTTRMEQTAEAGEIVVSQATAARLPPDALGHPKGDGRLLRWRRVVDGGPGPVPARPVAPDAVERTVPIALRARLAERDVESEHRSACIGFVKFKGVDTCIAQEGPEGAAGALAAVIEAVQDAADAESVTFLASDIDADGGKVILAAGVPTAREDDEGRILRVARALVESSLPLPLQVGINSGHVFAGDIGTEFRRTFTVMGDTVNLAARLMAAAAPSEVLATGPLLDRARTQFAAEALEPLRVKGKSEPVLAYRVGKAVGARSTTLGALPFRGRDKELMVLLDAYDSARAGHGTVAVVEAERGAGKTRLVAELLDALPDRPVPPASGPHIERPAPGAPAVLRLQGEPNGAALPYLPLRSALRALLGVEERGSAGGRQLLAALSTLDPALLPWASLLAPAVEADVPETPEVAALADEFVRDKVADLIVAVLDAAVKGPLVVVAEDAHWFDDTTSAICRALSQAASPRPWFVCVTRRPGGGGYDPSHADAHLRLTPLGDDAARELVDCATDGAPLRPHELQGVVARAGGNPLFLEELLRIIRTTDVAALPDSVEAVAMREIDSLASAERRALRLASVLGRAFDRDLLERFVAAEGIEGGGVADRLSEQVVEEGPGRLRFRHAVLQEAAYQSLPFRTRLAMHRRAGETIEKLGSSAGDADALLSTHYLAAQDWARTWRYARRAARQAQSAHAPGEAAVHLERAATAARRLGDVDAAELCALYSALGETCELLGEYARADDAYRRAETTGDDALVVATVAERRAHLRSEFLGRPSAAVRQLQSALTRVADVGPAAEHVRAALLARRADVRMRQGRLPEAVRCSREAAEVAEGAAAPAALALALNTLDTCLLQLGRTDEATHMQRVLELYEALGDHVHVAMTLGNLAGVAFFDARWDEAAEFVSRSAEASRVAGDLAGTAIAELNLGEIRINQGRFEEAEALLGPARRVLESFGYRVMAAMATMQLGRLRAFSGDVDGGTSLIRSALSTLAEIGAATDALEARGRLAEALVAGGRYDEAAAALAEARAVERAGSETSYTALLDRVELTLLAATSAGDRGAIAVAVEAVAARARRMGAPYDLLVTLTLAAQAGIEHDAVEAARLRSSLGVVRLPVLPGAPATRPPAG